ncbi:MAG: DUF934 domain-containing protein [Gammaproteobacteria bacterium]|nr:DUF934 domain-containing protein [Gammaproteobacteria bacterium]
MRQILWQREVRADCWRYPGEAGDGPRVQTLSELLADANRPPGAGTGVWLGPIDEVALLVPQLPQLALIVVNFEASGDGRGYSQGQLLRQRLGYQRELRAAGAIRRDHLFLLARCGFDAFDFAPGEDPRAALAGLDSYSVGYQPASGTLVQPRMRTPG